MSDEQKPVFNSDRPLTDPAQDRFSREKFAEMLAKSIVEMDQPEGLVIGLYGKWGTGKTTLLNFVRHYLKTDFKDQEPVIIEFNPWWFSSESNLTWHFLNQFSATLASRNQKFYKAAARGIRSIADLLAIAPITGADIPQRLAGHLLDLDDASISNLKESVEKELNRSKHKILFIIDDIDRLTTDEIRELFRTMKAIANFPNVVYLVAFDDDVVAKALEDVQGISGRDYLEKIVQVSLPVPYVSYMSAFNMKSMLRRQLDLLFELFEDRNWEQYRHAFESVYDDVHLHSLLKTPRDVIRLTNALKVTYSTVRGEVNTIEYVLVEALRVFRSDVYHWIYSNKRYLIQRFGYESAGADTAIYRDARRIVEFLFPAIANQNSSSDRQNIGDLRIADVDRFDMYFCFLLPHNVISQSELNDLLNSAHDKKEFVATLRRYTDDQRLLQLLDLLSENYRRVEKWAIPEVIDGLMMIGDELAHNKHQQPEETLGYIRKVINAFLRSLDSQARAKTLASAIEHGQAITLIAHVIIEHGEHQVDKGEMVRLFGEAEIERLERLTLEKIREWSQSTAWGDAVVLESVLYLWRRIGSNGEVAEWVNERLHSNAEIALLLEKHLKRIVRPRSPVMRVPHLNPKWLELDGSILNELDKRVIRILEEDRDITPEQKTALRQYHRECEWLSKGEDPELFWYHHEPDAPEQSED